MKRFEFSLDKIYRFKGQILAKEKNILAQLRKRRDEIEQKAIDIEGYRAVKKSDLRASQKLGMHSSELATYQFMLDNTRLQLEALRLELAKADAEVARQLKIVLKASQELSSLEKLEEKRRNDYLQQETRENHAEMLEHVMIAMTYNQ